MKEPLFQRCEGGEGKEILSQNVFYVDLKLTVEESDDANLGRKLLRRFAETEYHKELRV